MVATTPYERMLVYAHTLKDRPAEDWEPLYGPDGHAEKTARIMESFPQLFADGVFPDEKRLLRFIGMTHDMGKASNAFQRYLHGGDRADHKTAATAYAATHPKLLGKLLPYVFFGHHGGLPYGVHMFDEKLRGYSMPDEVAAGLPADVDAPAGLPVPNLTAGATTTPEAVFSAMMAVRMLHSSLVDADWLATESFTEPAAAKARQSIAYDSIEELSRKVETFIGERERNAAGSINELRKRIHHSCHAAGEKARGVYRLNVPTGGGKTLSSLSFALHHAERHGMTRVIYVIPFTSIIEQTAHEFRGVVGDANVVEHQSNIQPDKDTPRNRAAAENWDAPLVVTTSVQFFESLFSARNGRCRKLHNIANSVIVFDEAQNLPTEYLAPILQVMKVLRRQYGCTLLLCTATQPALEYREKLFEIGWPKTEVGSLLGDDFERELAIKMKRVEVEFLGATDTPTLLNHFNGTGEQSALFIVNLTRQAQDLFNALKAAGHTGLYHLSARMCPAHRTDVLDDVRKRLADGLPTILVATRVVEAGVDISFPIVYRDRCGLDSLAQSAGRCNRHGEAPMGHVYAYEAAEDEYALPASFADLRAGAYAMRDTLDVMQPADVFAADVVEKYFNLFYNKRREGTLRWDQHGIGELVGQTGRKAEVWDFPAIEDAFRMIPGGQRTLLVPYGDGVEDIRNEILRAVETKVPIPRRLRQLIQQHSVAVYDQEWSRLYPEHIEVLDEENGICMLNFNSKELYDAGTGLLRDASLNLSYVL